MVGLALDPPPSRPSQRRGGLRRAALPAAFVLTLAAGFWLGRVSAKRGWFEGGEGASTATSTARESKGPDPTATSTPTPTPTATSTSTATPTPTSTSTATATATATPTPTAAAPLAADAPRRLVVTLAGPLEDAVATALGSDRALAEELTAVVNRLLVWDLRVSRDARKGDRLEVLWTPPQAAAPGVPQSGEPVVEAVRYASSKLGSVIAAYRFRAEGDRWARYYRPDGTELEPRLLDAVITDYEQITSLLRDGRRHKGIDFKAPVGSPVRAPFDGVIERRNWNWSGNGNCLDIRDPATGRHAIFLHLDVLPKDMAVGRKVRKGEVVAASGNSGRSFAPHLHFQLEDAAGKVLDPFEVQRSERRSVSAAQKAAFEAEKARLEAALKG